MEKKVYIGVGHGGSDYGAVGYVVEKQANLRMALACAKCLRDNGVSVKLSRTTDCDSSIFEKVKEANCWGADLAIDIHNNAGGAYGAEVFYSVNGGKGKKLATNILENLVKIGQNNRGIKQRAEGDMDYFGFIRMTDMPAVITEAAFVDNPSDASKIKTEAQCNKFGIAIARGILDTLGISTISKVTGYYKVQIGAFKNKKNAEKLKNELKKKGYSAMIVRS